MASSTTPKGKGMEDVDVVRDRRKAVEELVRGREFANQLRQVIKLGGDESAKAAATPFAHHLLRNVLTTFANTLFLLNKYPTYQSHDQIMQPHLDSCLVSPAKSEDSQDSCSCKSPTLKDRRGCYKRKRTVETWKKVSETPTDHDGHQWRKYGQKPIQNAKYSRNYFRCTHKYDQGCQATKQVQRIQEAPPLYRTTYYGHHTCGNLLNPEIILDSTSPPDSSILLSFDNSLPNPANPFLSSSLFPSSSTPAKEECNNNNNKDQEVPSSTTEPTLDNSSRHVTLSSTLELDDYWDDMMMSGVLYGSVDDDFQSFLGF